MDKAPKIPGGDHNQAHEITRFEEWIDFRVGFNLLNTSDTLLNETLIEPEPTVNSAPDPIHHEEQIRVGGFP